MQIPAAGQGVGKGVFKQQRDGDDHFVGHSGSLAETSAEPFMSFILCSFSISHQHPAADASREIACSVNLFEQRACHIP